MPDVTKLAKPKQTFTADWESLKKRNPAPDWFCYAKFDAEQGPAAQCEREVGRAGFEPTPLVLSKTTISASGGTESGTPNSKDPDLALVVERWPDLPEHIKAAIKALIQTNNTEKK